MTDGTTVRVEDLTAAPAGEWDALALRSPGGETLQCHAWGEFKSRGGWRIGRYRIDDAGGPAGVVSIQERALAAPITRRLPEVVGSTLPLDAVAGRFLYAPTGPVLLRPDDPGSATSVLEGLRRIARSRHAALLIIDPAWPASSRPATALASAGFRAARRDIQVSRTGMYLPLHADEADQRQLVNENTRRNVEKARKAGVQIVRVDASSEPDTITDALAVAYRMLEETGRRTGFTLRPESYHSAASRALIEAGAAVLWFARLDGRDIAHTLLHLAGERAVLFQSGEGEVEQRRVPGNFLLQWSIIRWLADEGYRVYDLGGVDTHDAPGMPRDETHPLWNLARFKLQWGAEPVEFVGAMELAPSRIRGAALRTAWRFADRRRGGAPDPVAG